jgi:hypothetical protein
MTLPILDDSLYERDGYGCVIPKKIEDGNQSGHHPYAGTSIADNIVRRDPNKKWW